MKAFLLLSLSSALLCASCKATETLNAQAELPATTQAAPSTPIQLNDLGKVKFNGPATIILGTGNKGTTSDNTQAGQKGGAAATAPAATATGEETALPWQLMLGALALMALLCTWIGAKCASKLRWLPFLCLLLGLLTVPGRAQQLVITESHRFSYKDAKRVARQHTKAARRNHRQNRQDLHRLEVDHRRRLKESRHQRSAPQAGQ